MAHPRGEAQGHPERRAAHRTVLAITLFFALAAVSVSAGLVVYTAWLHDLKNGLFALLFAVLSTRAVLSWCLWLESAQPSATGRRQDPGGRKPADEAIR